MLTELRPAESKGRALFCKRVNVFGHVGRIRRGEPEIHFRVRPHQVEGEAIHIRIFPRDQIEWWGIGQLGALASAGGDDVARGTSQLGKPLASLGVGTKSRRTIDHGQDGSRATKQKCLHDVISKQGEMWFFGFSGGLRRS
jgi:hypothetical protein